MEISASEYFRVDLQDQLPQQEIVRRQEIKRWLEWQFDRWESDEQHLWSAIPHANTLSFIGLNWSSILPKLRHYINHKHVAFEILSELQLCPIRASIVNSYRSRHKRPPDTWLYSQYRQYGIRIQDFGETIQKYHIPFIDVTGNPDVPYDSHLKFRNTSRYLMSRMAPRPFSQGVSSTCRLIIFPQTRYSFIEDEMFHSLYPLPEEQAKLMAHKLLHRLQGNSGYFNALPNPYTDSFTQKTYDGRSVRAFQYFAALYPVIEFQFVDDYNNRKATEKFITSIQKQDLKGFPTISQGRYSRKFDLAEESKFRSTVLHGDTCPERIQSARALFEYACGDHDTLKLDARQTSLLGDFEASISIEKRLIVVDPLWILIFPESDTICAFRNESMDDPFKEIWGDMNGPQDMGHLLIQLVNNADKCMGSYESIYRKRLSSLQFQLHSTGDHHLVKLLSDYVAELAILLDPLQSQINTLKHWYNCQESIWRQSSALTRDMFENAIKTREIHLESLKRLHERAREHQALLFQLSNTEAAYLQSQVAIEMAKETKLQVQLALKMAIQNKSILIFTIITVIFLPLSFFTSYFGMNTDDIRSMEKGQWFFWSVSAPLSIAINVITFLIAFKGRIRETLSKPFRRRNKMIEVDSLSKVDD
ncbi:uncharacterized protein LY89DRAFT_684771 [Mollisia scopiformis]|uniref:Uncharacterized protein n=1 Tax=Mollisia scopiformis TaxID=149040 RepID=A0A194X924_MOLSC|nr:uncharacterized protein LY89DRAFT_684771 [Mollisia scopiformis]KUJ16671.1 hypothetical protein LY89DRAFT_684771 [Mollisia scopiformis]